MAWFNLFERKADTKKAIPLKRSFKGASGGRLFADFFSSSASADQELKQALVTLRNRSRELSRNDAYVSRYLNLLTSNVVGASGIRVNSKARDPSGTLDQGANALIESAWKKFSKKVRHIGLSSIMLSWKCSELIMMTILLMSLVW